MGPTAGLYDMEKTEFSTLPGLELLTLGRPARSHSLYPRYLGLIHYLIFNFPKINASL
jgi:hypothetical protein